MSSGRRSRFDSARRGLLAGAALAALCSPAAWAQAPGAAAPAAPKAPQAPGPDGLTPNEMYLEADLVVRNDKTHVTTATGQAEMRIDGRTLRADELTYTEDTGVVHAKGHIQIINADGTVETATEAVIDNKSKAGAASGFTARLDKNIKIAAASVVRRDDTIQQLNNAIYTPCPICVGDKPVRPTWAIQADKVVQDKKKEIVYYRNAVIRMFGVPVIYLPVFWHAAPQAERASGLLQPKVSLSDRRGFSYEQPYLIVTSPSSDVTLSPQINTKVNPFLNGRVRKRFYSGTVDARFGFTYDRDFNSDGVRVGDRTSRSYVLAGGGFQIDEKWRWGFTAERTSDRLIFDKYEISGVYEARGPYVADDRRLISQLYAVRQDDRSYFSVAGMTVQGLRPGDNDRAFPVVGPLVDARWEPAQGIAGGRLRLRASAVALSREQSQYDVAGQRTPGLDSRRVTTEADWRASWTSPMGFRIDPFADVRADAYNLNDLPASVSHVSSNQTRGLAVVGADFSMPFFRRWKEATIILEPLAQVAVSPNVRQIVISRSATGAPVYLNEDSVAFEFDESNLFRSDKFPGYDLYEQGARLNVAGRASVLWDDGRRASLLVGRSFRDERDNVFTPGSGLSSQDSDWIVAGDAQPIKGLTLFTRARLDSETFAIHREETGANVATKWGSGYVRYLRDDSDINGAKTENLDLGAEVYLTKHWGISAYGNRDLVQDAWVIRDLGIIYRDDCTRFEIVYRHEDTVVGRLGPSDSVAIRITLATLGDPNPPLR
jgi:LPS-assembly protein